MNLHDVSVASLKELGRTPLLVLHSKIEKALKELTVENLTSTRKKILIIAHEAGYSLGDLFPEAVKQNSNEKVKGTKKRSSKAIVNPENPEQVYGGYGPKPQWLKDMQELEAMELAEKKQSESSEPIVQVETKSIYQAPFSVSIN